MPFASHIIKRGRTIHTSAAYPRISPTVSVLPRAALAAHDGSRHRLRGRRARALRSREAVRRGPPQEGNDTQRHPDRRLGLAGLAPARRLVQGDARRGRLARRFATSPAQPSTPASVPTASGATTDRASAYRVAGAAPRHDRLRLRGRPFRFCARCRSAPRRPAFARDALLRALHGRLSQSGNRVSSRFSSIAKAERWRKRPIPTRSRASGSPPPRACRTNRSREFSAPNWRRRPPEDALSPTACGNGRPTANAPIRPSRRMAWAKRKAR